MRDGTFSYFLDTQRHRSSCDSENIKHIYKCLTNITIYHENKNEKSNHAILSFVWKTIFEEKNPYNATHKTLTNSKLRVENLTNKPYLLFKTMRQAIYFIFFIYRSSDATFVIFIVLFLFASKTKTCNDNGQ